MCCSHEAVCCDPGEPEAFLPFLSRTLRELLQQPGTGSSPRPKGENRNQILPVELPESAPCRSTSKDTWRQGRTGKALGICSALGLGPGEASVCPPVGVSVPLGGSNKEIIATEQPQPRGAEIRSWKCLSWGWGRWQQTQQSTQQTLLLLGLLTSNIAFTMQITKF